jgi:hypothetical protein
VFIIVEIILEHSGSCFCSDSTVPAPLEQGSKILLLARTFTVECGTTPEIQKTVY